MKPPSKTEAFHNNLKMTKAERPIPGKTRKVLIKDIECNPARQPRAEMDKNYVAELKEHLSNGGTLPPITIFAVGNKAPFFLSDGWHRLKANADFKEIEAEIKEGDATSAFYYSLQANTGHGKRLTNADKRRKVTLALEDEGLALWTDIKLSEWCGVSHMLVREIRAEMENSVRSSSNSNADSEPKTPKSTNEHLNSDNPKEAPKRVGKDGKSYPAKKPKAAPAKKPLTDKVPKKEELSREIVKDHNGDEVPEAIAPEFLRAERELREQINAAQSIKNFLERDESITVELRGLREAAKDLLAGLKTHGTKHVLCPKCSGKKCAVCSKRGFMSNYFATKGMGKKEE